MNNQLKQFGIILNDEDLTMLQFDDASDYMNALLEIPSTRIFNTWKH